MEEMRINHLPAPTWNWLKVNDAKVCLAENFERCSVEYRSDEVSLEESPKGAYGKTDFDAFSTSMGSQFSDYILGKEHSEQYLYIEKELEKPVFLTFNTDEKEAAAFSGRYELKEDAAATIIMTYRGTEKISAKMAAFDSRFKLGKRAKLKLVQLFLTGEETTLFNDVSAELEEEASFDVVHIILSGRKNYSGCLAKLLGRKASTNMEIAYMTGEEDFLDCNYVAEHYGKKTNSLIYSNGVMEHKSEKVFRGTIDFKRGSAESVGEEKEDVLLLDDDVINKTVPLILCQEEDVEGAHGATLGKLSEDILFYLTARGIDEETAYQMVARGRIASSIRKIGDPETEEMVLREIGMGQEEE